MSRRNKPRPPFGSVVVGDPFVIYPEITLPDPKSISIDSELVLSYLNFNKFWRNSTYHLGDGVPKTEVESLDIERYYSDTLKPKKSKSSSFYDYLILRPDNFPKELLGDTPRQRRPVKRAKWRQDLQKLDVLEELEARFLKAQGEEEKEEDLKAQGEEEKEEEDDDDDDDDEEEEESQGEEESDHGDYDHNQDFDDDEDDYNQADGKNSSKDDNWFY